MDWIESHKAILWHRKTGRLMRALSISRIEAVGYLHAFWWWCTDNAPEGDLGGVDVEDIADGALWEADPRAFLDGLIHAGWVDQAGAGPCVHDWYEHVGKLIERRKADAQRKRNARLGIVQETSAGHPPDGARTVPNRTLPNPTVPEESTSTPAPAQERKLAAVPKAGADKAAKREVKTALPRDFTVTPRMEVWAAEKVPQLSSIDEATEEWLDYCRRENARFSDWEAAWRNAMRRAQEFEESRKGKHNASNNNGRRPGPAERAAETINSAIFG